MKPIAVIILNWNGAEMLRRFLPDVVATTNAAIARVIVADNGSTDDSLRVLAEQFPTVEVIRFDRNYGFAEGYNRAIMQVDNEYVILLNSDVAPTAGWTEQLYRYMHTHPRCAACQPKIRAVNDTTKFEYAGACGGFLDRNGYPYCRGRIFSTIETDNGQYEEPIQVDWASGAALMIRRALYHRAGGLDPRFFAHMEEIDLCWRLRRMDYTVDVVPQAVVFHLGGGALPMGNPRKTYLNFRNNLLLLLKNLPAKGRRRALIRRRLLDTIAWAKYMLTFDLPSANAILRAHRDFRRMKKEYLTPATPATTDTSVPSNPSNPNIENTLTGILPSPATTNPLTTRPNILIQYYLLRHKTYTDLPQGR